MREFLLISTVVVAAAFGWRVMAWLDRFVDRMRRPRDARISSGASDRAVRVGFSDPLIADLLNGVVESYTKFQPETSVRLLSGNPDELVCELSAHRLDLAILPATTVMHTLGCHRVKEILLKTYAETTDAWKIVCLNRWHSIAVTRFISFLSGKFENRRTQK